MSSTGRPVNLSNYSYGTREQLVMALTHFANHVYVHVHLTLIPVFMKEFNLSLWHVGIMVMIPLLFEAMATIPAGIVADKLGYFRQIMISLGITAIAAFLMTQASNPYFVVLALSLLAISTTIYHPPAYGAVSQMFQERRNRTLGIHGAGGTLGWALGPLSVGALLAYGWRTVYLVWIPPTLIGIFLLAKMSPLQANALKQETGAQGGLRSMFTAGLSIILVMIAVSSFGKQIVSTLMSPYIVLGRGFSVQNASYVMGAMSLAGIAAAPIGGLFADRLGEKRWLTVTSSALIIALLAFIQAGSINELLLYAVLYGYSSYSGMGATAALISYFTPMSRRGLGYALFFLPSYIAGAAAPTIGTAIAEAYGMGMAFSLAIVFLIGSIAILQKIPHTKMSKG